MEQQRTDGPDTEQDTTPRHKAESVATSSDEPEAPDQTVYPMPQEQQPDPVYGFDAPPPPQESREDE